VHAGGPIGAAAPTGVVPLLRFAVQGAEALRPAAVPTIRFTVRIDSGGAAIRSIQLETQVRIAATRRAYDAAEQERLAELFGAPHRWGETLRSFLWANLTRVVPPFEGETLAHLDMPCTYDFEVSATKYLAGVRAGEVPLELLFSGAVFHSEGGRLQVTRVSWESEAEYRLPVAVWRAAMDQHFPDAAWLRLDRAAFDRLAAYKARHTLLTWEEAVASLLDRAGER
jgi:Family of unknown function (DUF6084)